MMKENNFSEIIGRKVPYEVPAEFFDTITEKTLQKVRHRKHKTKIRIITIWISAAAAVALIIVISGLNFNWHSGLKEPAPVAENKTQMPEAEQHDKQPVLLDSKAETSTVPEKENKTSGTAFMEEKPQETFENLLAALSEEELTVIARQLSAELYLNEITEE